MWTAPHAEQDRISDPPPLNNTGSGDDMKKTNPFASQNIRQKYDAFRGSTSTEAKTMDTGRRTGCTSSAPDWIVQDLCEHRCTDEQDHSSVRQDRYYHVTWI